MRARVVVGAGDQPGLVVTDESGKEAAPGFAPPHPESGASNSKEDVAPWRRPGSLRARPTNRSVDWNMEKLLREENGRNKCANIKRSCIIFLMCKCESSVKFFDQIKK